MLGCFERALYPTGQPRREARSRPSSTAPPARGAAARSTPTTASSSAAATLARGARRALPGTIVTTSGGCAAHLASGARPRAGARALAVARRARRRGAPTATGDGAPPAHRPPGLLPPAQRPRASSREPRELIARLGEYVELPSAGAVLRRGRDLRAPAPRGQRARPRPPPRRDRRRGPRRDRRRQPRLLPPARAGREAARAAHAGRAPGRARGRARAEPCALRHRPAERDSRSLTSSGRSCCVQCPQPSSSTRVAQPRDEHGAGSGAGGPSRGSRRPGRACPRCTAPAASPPRRATARAAPSCGPGCGTSSARR